MTEKPNPTNKLKLYCNTCAFCHGGTRFLCFHPSYIGGDGDGVSLTVMEQEFVKRMGCASHSGAREYLMRDVIEKLQATIKCNSRWNKLELYYVGVNAATEEAIDLIRGRGKK